ncbi:DUF4362 domain-containing protein [Paenibacillus sp. OSY-SE]|uniref:DUF4362 domain-containing protein n=1 Tax=Paenibacillus sp. OSY-SE TaxID=1196323 RepID=UPI00035D96E9|nr:DUF4362 domain-containing protein [Paenibacillus sp. OSY-SE]
MIKQGRKRWEIHLWIDARYVYGMYTYVSDTGTGYKLTTESTRDLYNLIWGIRYDFKQVATNGDFVNAHSKLSNLDIWEKFVTNVKVGVKDEIQVVQYTIEGGPIFDNLSFDGETIRHMYDNTHDQYGTPTKRLEFCKSIDEIKTDRGTEYKLSSCGDGFVGEVLLFGYDMVSDKPYMYFYDSRDGYTQHENSIIFFGSGALRAKEYMNNQENDIFDVNSVIDLFVNTIWETAKVEKTVGENIQCIIISKKDCAIWI